MSSKITRQEAYIKLQVILIVINNCKPTSNKTTKEELVACLRDVQHRTEILAASLQTE